MLWKTLEDNWRIIAAVMLLLMLVVTAKIARSNYDRALIAEKELKLSQDTIKDMQTRQRDVAALDTKYTQEIADAKATIEGLQHDVATGKRRLQLNATCKNNFSSASSLGDASTPGLNPDAERDYWRLRGGINTVTSQVKYLQDYINQQCLK
ncbi:lysis protein [Enterobacter sp. R1(2018)]|uniref:lysis protein n=1 Tax=Enterobacter sp. R1(2018) TaxID=2447891 RepID=UPI000EAC409C|nr:lysis protein [Enterobacter sp. R1(2018)]RKQ38383.1 lysis protein [Enterobacter sp. R1(2018)]